MNVIESGVGELIQPPDMNAFREWNRTKKSRKLMDKLMTEAEAVRQFVYDGCYIGTELYGTVRCPMTLVRETGTEGLYLMPASIAMASLDRQSGRLDGLGLVLQRATRQLREGFEYILVDCPPALGILLINALAACERSPRRYETRPGLARFVANQYERLRVSEQNLARTRENICKLRMCCRGRHRVGAQAAPASSSSMISVSSTPSAYQARTSASSSTVCIYSVAISLQLMS